MNYIIHLPLWYKGGCSLLQKKNAMAPVRHIHFRIRTSTYDMLRHVLEGSAHRSMSALVDEILEQELPKRLKKTDQAADVMRSLARRDG